MSYHYTRNKEEDIIYEYFPNQRIPSSISFNGYSINEQNFKTLENYCKFIWKWEATYWNYSRFIYTHGWKK